MSYERKISKIILETAQLGFPEKNPETILKRVINTKDI